MFPDEMREADLEKTKYGLRPRSEGWFVLNVAEAEWSRRGEFGSYCRFEGGRRFEQIGVNVHVLEPGKPACHYHRENQQEDFLVLSGECLLIVEGRERRLKAWDFVHCPAGTNHVFVGGEAGPCAVLMIGARQGEQELVYPVNDVARKHGAGVAKETADPKVSYAHVAKAQPCAPQWPLDARKET